MNKASYPGDKVQFNSGFLSVKKKKRKEICAKNLMGAKHVRYEIIYSEKQTLNYVSIYTHMYYMYNYRVGRGYRAV